MVKQIPTKVQWTKTQKPLANEKQAQGILN